MDSAASATHSCVSSRQSNQCAALPSAVPQRPRRRLQVYRHRPRFVRMALVVGWSGPSTRSLSARVASYGESARLKLPTTR
jgi:hypothetical protein